MNIDLKDIPDPVIKINRKKRRKKKKLTNENNKKDKIQHIDLLFDKSFKKKYFLEQNIVNKNKETISKTKSKTISKTKSKTISKTK